MHECRSTADAEFIRVYQLTSRFLRMPSTIILGFGCMCEERLRIVH